MKKILLLSTCFLMANLSYGQLDKNFTYYMADQISFNPGATGFRGYCGTLIYRNQWLGFEGAPSTFLFNGQANIEKYGLGVGISFANDRIGLQQTNDFKANIAKHFEIVGAGYLSVGLGVGVFNMGVQPDWIAPETLNDPGLPTGESASALDLNFGLFWRDADERYYVGISSTHLTAPTLNLGATGAEFRVNRHYYVTGGVNITYDMLQIHPKLTLKPAFLVISDGVSTTADVTAIADFRLRPEQSIFAGITYRRQDALSLLAGWSMDITPKSSPQHSNLGTLMSTTPDVLNIGLAYDFTVSAINTPSNGTFEVWANYCMFPKDPAIARYGNPFILE